MPAIDTRMTTSTRRWTILASAIGVVLLGAVAAAAFLLSYKILPPPGIAPVIADEENSTYASTPCIMANTLDRELINNRNEVSDPDKTLELKPYANEKTIANVTSDPRWKRDTACNYAFGFDQIVTRWMRLTGYRSRWADDGHWRW
ncbi:MAG: hypothetical protein J0I29_05585 [Rhizobiales bacterium]|nr:hypothetical protein [Hyphomicrobiales bacterium]